ncbi:unnamed protein product [Paramecium sonneborni]|uniref:Protein kinase domain-containing protein n=1 Tax=Paramecium sonneborni TaxID=65129 RepID=A0A8S1KNK4_9CILI|nr:unnamed protein product [Paramecium sonneborni]
MMEKQNQEIQIFDLDKQIIQMNQYEKSILSQNNIQNSIRSNIKLKDIQVLSHLGKGTFGQVFKVIYKNKIYALKQQLKQQVLQDVKYIQSELSIMKYLNHPFVVKLYHSFQTQNYLYMLLEYCENGDLTNYMAKGTIIQESQAIFIIAQIILALEYLHSLNLIYRDLKPENVMITNNNYIKLIDFGLSKEGFNITHTFCGSPAYLSPELLNGQGVTQSTDLYTMGLLLYEMLSGYPPHFSNNIRLLLNGIQNEELRIPKNFSGSVKNFLEQVITKDPFQRLNIKQIKNHIIFAEIDWSKLKSQEYLAPKLKKKEINKQYQIVKLIDHDYPSDGERINEVFGWDYSSQH